MYLIKSLTKYQVLFIVALILFIPAYFINLGMLPFIDDEGIRGLVALEMKLSGDFITPTLSGALYFKKPPLYNWIILGFFEMSGKYNEFWMRVPAVLSIFLFTLTIYFSLRKEVGEKIAIITSLMFMTCGRIIIYESLHGLIDLCYSWLTYLSFITVYKMYKKGKLMLLFLFVYVISSVTYLMKGLPTILFTGITLLTFFVWKKQLKLLFSWKHFVGIGIFLFIAGGYYYLYFSKNNISFHDLFGVLFSESTRRTGLRFGFGKTVLHFFTFPFEQIYHFLPWSVFVVFIIRKDFLKKLKENEFVCFSALIFISNIIIYWFSVEVFARYILMLIPLAYTVLVFFYENRTTKQEWLNRIIIQYLFPALMIIILIAFYGASKFYPEIKSFDHIILKLAFLTVAIISVFILFLKRGYIRIPLFILFMLIFRIGFNWLVIPKRHATGRETISRAEAIKLGKAYKCKRLRSYWNPKIDPNPYYGKIITRYSFLFYVTAESQQILYQESETKKKAFYLVHERHFEKVYFEPLDTILPYGNQKPIYVCKPITD